MRKPRDAAEAECSRLEAARRKVNPFALWRRAGAAPQPVLAMLEFAVD